MRFIYLMVLIFTIFAFAISGAERTHAVSQPIATIDLQGDWDFAYTPERQNKSPANEIFKGEMSVPGCWDDFFSQQQARQLWPEARFNPDYLELQLPVMTGFGNAPDASLPYLLGAGWYRKNIDVPAEWCGRQIVLHVGRVVMEAYVYVNDRLVHHHLGHSLPWEAVLSSHLEYGKSNELVICVDNRRNDRLGCSIRGWKGRSGGIYGPVSLKVSGKARIADWHVYPTNDCLQWRIDIDGDTSQDYELRWKMIDSKSGQEYGSGAQPAASKHVAWKTGKLGIPLWSDNDPKLVEVRLELVENDHLLDKVQATFGLRRLTRNGLGLELNGNPIYLRGYCECAYFPETCTPPTDIDWYRRHIRRLKQIGFNWIRGHTWPLNEQYLQAADELGMLVQVEPPRGYGIEEWRHIIRACRKHPSVVLYCCGNEETLDEPKIAFLRRCADELRQLSPDALFMPQEAMRGVEYHLQGVPQQQLCSQPFLHYPQRLKTLREFSDVFGQYTWGWLSYSTLSGSLLDLDKRLAIYERPCLSHELGIIGGYLDLSLEDRYRETRIGTALFSKVRKSIEDAGLLERTERYHKNSVAWHMLIAKQACEKARRSRYIAGYDMLGACDVHWHRSGYCCGLLNEFDQFKANVTAADILCFNAPSILMIGQHKKRNLFAGQSLQREVFVSWFGEIALPAAKLNWSLKTPDGKLLGRGEQYTLPVQQGQVASLGTINVPLPTVEKATKTHLRVVLSAPDVEIKNNWDYWIFPRLTPKKHNNILVTNQLDSTALKRLSQGGRVILLGYKPFPAMIMNFQMGTAGRPERNLATLIDKHPLTNIFPHDNFCDWQFATMLDRAVPVRFDKLDVRFDPIIEVASSFKRIRKQALLFEWRVGQGRILICGLNLHNTDPAGAYFRHVLLDYAAGDLFQPQTQVTLEKLSKMTKLNVPSLQKQPKTDKALDPSGQLPRRR